ncbi:[citrate (pro-3S)-lyase] ligase [Aerococcaceae bacterium zg-B36]|uniref:[citrate (pro-3S)-lyase] ligase n=1 Tax=Aerococcaceae bacterium zg-252 TaxID=2796928 RepID=UPI001BD88CFB|nr:[citrate (pro-3S)-lyase] ligase [Aerococcaceae bacterium zg-B36]
MNYQVVPINPFNKRHTQKVIQLLEQEKIRLDKHLDYTCGIFNEDNQLIATGSCFKNTLRCIAVDSKYHGQGLMNKLISHLVSEQFERGNFHLFLYTKASCRNQFKDLGFYEIAYIENQIVFMENKRDGFKDYLNQLTNISVQATQSTAALVMNCNPFTLGHQYLIEKAASENDIVHVFVVEEDASVFPYSVRKELVEKGTAHLKNVIIHSTGPYLISSATFPSYFQKDSTAVITSQTNVDCHIFTQIAQHLGITRRYVGTEPFSPTTDIYNQTMHKVLHKAGIDVILVPRMENEHGFISASTVRQYLKDNLMDKVKEMVPPATYDFLTSPKGKEIIAAIKQMSEVRHY